MPPHQGRTIRTDLDQQAIFLATLISDSLEIESTEPPSLLQPLQGFKTHPQLSTPDCASGDPLACFTCEEKQLLGVETRSHVCAWLLKPLPLAGVSFLDCGTKILFSLDALNAAVLRTRTGPENFENNLKSGKSTPKPRNR